jgi:hypothetical protein
MRLMKRHRLLGAIIVLATLTIGFIVAWRAIYDCPFCSQANLNTNEPKNSYKEVGRQQSRQNEEWQMALKKVDEQSATWPTYQNTRLGISLRYPPHIKDGTVEFVEAGNIVFVTNSTSDLYAHRNDLPNESNQEILDAAKKYMDGLVAWAIVTGDAHSKADLSSFIANLKGCEIGPLGTTTQSGVYNVGLVPVKPGPPDDPNGPDSSCWINWIMAFKYSPEHQRAAKWDIGQEGRFILSSSDVDDPNCDEVYVCAADSAMKASFRFIPRDGQASSSPQI